MDLLRGNWCNEFWPLRNFLYNDNVQLLSNYCFFSFGIKHPPYPLDGFCLKRCGSVTYGTTAPVRYYLSTALVLLWSSVPCRQRSRPLPSSIRACIRGPPKTGDEEWKTEANLAENG